MTVDRYTKLLLTVIAIELGWIAINGTGGAPVLAQRTEATPVIIRGVEGPPGKQPMIPVTVMGSTILRVESERPLEVVASRPVKIEADRPIPVESGNEPLLIRTVSDPPANRPGVAPGAFKP
jgi:hypothetical protein